MKDILSSSSSPSPSLSSSSRDNYYAYPSQQRQRRQQQNFALILPVLFYEYLAMSIARSLIPTLLVQAYGKHTYLALGLMETAKGILAFISCPLFGRLSDQVGRKYCLLFTVVGTTLPVCALAFTSNMYIFAILTSISGIFSATFPLTFAYISDCVDKKKRAPAYGLALATFGLSFCLGPISGSYLAEQVGDRSVFISSVILVVVDVLYIIFYLPETVRIQDSGPNSKGLKGMYNTAVEYLPNTWNFQETFRVFRSDPFMTNLAVVVFLYYIAVWAIVSTMMVYVTRHLQFSTIALGWLLSVYGLATMFSESVVVRYVVPFLGETASMRLGLLSFSIQCVVVAFSTSPSMIFISIFFSMIANLVYPSVSSLVSKVVDEDAQGEALGALNGIKALTEGFGPLLFGFLMAIFEGTPVPGAPYLCAAVLTLWAFLHSYELPPEPDMAIAKYNGQDDTIGLLSKEEVEQQQQNHDMEYQI
jgi:DHA1 family tetracycline resistance protein-like MFS transporter